MQSRWFVVAGLTAALLGCSGSQEKEQGPGGLVVTAAALTQAYQIQSVTITANPGGTTATLTYDPVDGQYKGSLILPVGAYTVDASAWADTNGDAVLELAGTGVASVVIYENVTTAAVIRIVDVTGPPPVPDHSPIIASLTLSGTGAIVGQTLNFAANVVDIDGDAISYLWSETCTSGSPSTFSAPNATATDWTPSAVGICTVRLDATANGKVDSVSFDLAVYSGTLPEGMVTVSAYFVSHPTVSQIAVYGTDATGTWFNWYVDRYSFDATMPYDVAVGATGMEIDAWSYDQVDGFAVSDDCGGSYSPASFYGNYQWGYWTAPTVPAVCTVTVSTYRDGLTDAFPIAVNVR